MKKIEIPLTRCPILIEFDAVDQEVLRYLLGFSEEISQINASWSVVEQERMKGFLCRLKTLLSYNGRDSRF
jgi:hypothetical protein